MGIPITKPFFDEEELRKVKEVLDSGWVTQGPVTAEFENIFSQYQDCQYAVAVSSCTAALHLALLALGIGKGDEVIVPAFTWITSASCVEYVGADVKFVDIEKESMNIDVSMIEPAITERTKAIIAVHLFGNPAKMDEIMAIAEKYHLYVIEDCACAIGTAYKGRKVGTTGKIGCFSFHPRKTITTGEGGMCVTNDKQLYNRLQQLRNHGASVTKRTAEYKKPYYMGVYDEVGYNLRLSDIQAAVGVAQFGKLPMLLNDRRRCAAYYLKKLSGIRALIVPDDRVHIGHTYQAFVVLLRSGDRNKRNAIMDAMASAGIQSRPGTIAITRTEFNRKKYNLDYGQFPVAEYCEDSSITLPIYLHMSMEDMDKVVDIMIRNI